MSHLKDCQNSYSSTPIMKAPKGNLDFPGGSVIKNPHVKKETQVQSLYQEDPWRRKCQPTPESLLGKSHGQRSLTSYSRWGHKRIDTTQQENNNKKKQKENLFSSFCYYFTDSGHWKKDCYKFKFFRCHQPSNQQLLQQLPNPQEYIGSLPNPLLSFFSLNINNTPFLFRPYETDTNFSSWFLYPIHLLGQGYLKEYHSRISSFKKCEMIPEFNSSHQSSQPDN